MPAGASPNQPGPEARTTGAGRKHGSVASCARSAESGQPVDKFEMVVEMPSKVRMNLKEGRYQVYDYDAMQWLSVNPVDGRAGRFELLPGESKIDPISRIRELSEGACRRTAGTSRRTRSRGS